MNYLDDDSDQCGDNETIESAPIPDIDTLTTEWLSVSTENIPSIRKEDIDNYFLYRYGS